MREWIKNLKVGDEVIVTSNMCGEPRISKVEKITPKGFIKVDGLLFDDNGSQRTSSWYKSYIIECSEEEKEKMRKKQIISKAYGLMRNTKSITYEQAEDVIKILDVN